MPGLWKSASLVCIDARTAAVPLVYVLVLYFLASFFLYCEMHLRFRGCPVVLDIELSVSAWYQKTRLVLLHATGLLLLLLAAGNGGVRHMF